MSDIKLSEIIEFGASEVETEVEQFGGDVPDHAAELLLDRANDVLQFVARAQLEGMEEDKFKDMVEERLVDLLLAFGAMDFEHELEIAAAFERRKDFIEDYRTFEKESKEVSGQKELGELFEKHLGEHVDNAPMGAAVPDLPDIGVEAGDNVDNKEYEHKESDRSYQ